MDSSGDSPGDLSKRSEAMPASTLRTNTLMQIIRAEYQERFADEPAREEVEAFVRQAFHARNIEATPALVTQTTAHLMGVVDEGQIAGKNIRHC